MHYEGTYIGGYEKSKNNQAAPKRGETQGTAHPLPNAYEKHGESVVRWTHFPTTWRFNRKALLI